MRCSIPKHCQKVLDCAEKNNYNKERGGISGKMQGVSSASFTCSRNRYMANIKRPPAERLLRFGRKR